MKTRIFLQISCAKTLLWLCLLVVTCQLNAQANLQKKAVRNAKLSASTQLKVSKALTATISGSTTAYLNSTNPEITFTGNGGTEPYTFVYTINGGTDLTLTTITGNSASVYASTNAIGTWTYTLKSVKDKTGTTVSQSGTVVITVNTMPDASIHSSAVSTYVNNQLVFRECYQPNGTLTFTNTSTTIPYNTNYTIDWGDNSGLFTAAQWSTTTHSYAPGNWTMTYTVVGQKPEDTSVQKIQVYIGSKPAVSMGSPGQTDNCSKMPVFFPISGTEKNTPDTKYTITFNDGSAPVEYNPASGLGGIVHTFAKSSCGTTSYSGSTAYPNSFSASIVAENACGVSAVSVVPIYISTAPVVNFNVANAVSPVNVSNNISNATTGFVNENGSCSVIPKLVWKISPATYVNGSGEIKPTFVLKGGEKLGDDYSLDNSNLWTPGSDKINPTFLVPGIYTVKLRVDTKRCGDDVVVKTICVEAPLLPKFSLSTAAECSPAIIAVTNTTDVSASCATSYKWDVVYSSNNCGAGTAIWSYVAGNQNAAQPTFKLDTPGNYKIKLTVTNSCGSFSQEQSVVVKGAPVVSVATIPNACGSAVIEPVAIVNACTNLPEQLTYEWSFPGGNPSSSSDLRPGKIIYPAEGKYKVVLSVKNDCGSSTINSNEFNVYPRPTIEPVANQGYCNGESLSEIKFNTSANCEVIWINNHPEIGLAAKGKGNIPSAILVNNERTSVVATIKAVALNTITQCSSDTLIFTIIVRPSANVLPVSNQQVSNSEYTTAVNFETINTDGITSYSWSSSLSNVGIATSGTGNIPSFKAVNTTHDVIVDTITVVPWYLNDTQSCEGIPMKFTITIHPSANVISPANRLICNGQKVSEISFSTQNVSGVTTYRWTNDNPTIGISASGTGNIASFTAMNSGTSVQTANIEVVPTYTAGSVTNVGEAVKFQIEVHPAPAFVEQPISSYLCRGGQASALKVSYKDGVGDVTYQWYSNTTKSTEGAKLLVGETKDTYNPPTNQPGAMYYFCILSSAADMCGAVSSDIATVSINNSAIISTEPVALQNVCVGAELTTPLQVQYIDGNGTPSYQWYSTSSAQNYDGVAIEGATNASFTPPVFTQVGRYFYYVMLHFSGDGCGALKSKIAEINVVPDPIIVTQPKPTQTLCQFKTAATLIVDATGGLGAFSYQWYQNTVDNNSSGKIIEGANSNTFTPSTEMIGTSYYYCVVSQPNGLSCFAVSQTSTVIVKHQPIISTQPVSKTLCQYQTSETLTVDLAFADEKTNYQWYSNTENSTQGASLLEGATKPYFQPSTDALGVLYYYCVMSGFEGGCTDLQSNIVSVTVQATPVIASASITLCDNEIMTFNPASITGNVVPNTTKYTWELPTVEPSNALIGALEQKIPVAGISQQLQNTTRSEVHVKYKITAVSGSCLSSPFWLDVELIPAIEVVSSVKNCTGYMLNDGAIQLQISGGSAASVTNGYDIKWEGPNGFSSTSADIANLPAGVYTLTIKDAKACSYVASYTVSEPEEIQIVLDEIKNVSCRQSASGRISVTVKGGTPGYNYSWTKDGLPFAITEDIADLTTGSYQLIVTDAMGYISKPQSFSIIEPSVINAQISNLRNVSCSGGNDGAIAVQVSGGMPFQNTEFPDGYKFIWSGPNGFASTQKNITDLLAGNYTLKITDNNNCDEVIAIELKQPTVLAIKLVVQSLTCYSANDASIQVEPSGGTPPYSIQWSNFGKGFKQMNLQPGKYKMTVTDANGCTISDSVLIAEANFSIHPVVKNVTCHGGSDGAIDLGIVGGKAPVSVVWNDDPTAGSVRNNLPAGTYSVTLVDGAPCQISKSFVISEAPELEISGSIQHAFDCLKANSGAITLTVIGGRLPYTYIWSNGLDSKDVANLIPGLYDVTVTDASGCSKRMQFEVLRQQPIKLQVDTELEYTCGAVGVNLKCIASATGGIPPFNYKWSVGSTKGLNNEIMRINRNSIVVLEATDAQGCRATYSFYANIPSTGISSQIVNCNTFSYQFFAETPQLFTNNMTYQWDFGDGTTSQQAVVTHSFNTIGVYKVRLKIYDNDCQYLFEKTVSVYPAIKVKLNKEPKLCMGGESVVHATGASSYKWSNGSQSDSMILNTAGTYHVIGYSESGCTDTLHFVASYFDNYNYHIFTDTEDITANKTMHLWSDAVAYSYFFWDFGDGEMAQGRDVYHTFTRPTDGFYDVKLSVVNPNGCTELVTKRIWLAVPDAAKIFAPTVDGNQTLFMKNWEMKLFNRNGILIYSGTAGWDGKYKGEYVSAGTYFYVITYPSEKGAKTKNGYVTVVR